MSNGAAETPLKEFARVANAEHRIEECLKRAKSEAGLADSEVRTWMGWHHHQTLSLLATWFLTQETRRGKKMDPAITLPQIREAIARLLHRSLDGDKPERLRRNMTRRLQRIERARLYHWRSHHRLAPKRVPQNE